MRTRKSRRGRGPRAPLWWQNTLRAWEIALAAPEVIAHRTARMAAAGSAPGARDRREFARMGQEKVQAFGESLSAMGMQMYTSNQELALRAVRQWSSAWTPLASLAASRSPAQLVKAQAALMRGLGSAAGDTRLADSFSRVVQKSLAPVHRRATGNAKRLRRAKIR